MYKVKITAFLLLLISLAQAMDAEKMGAITIKNIAENKSVIIPADLIPFKTIHQFQGGTITSPLSPHFFQPLKDLLYANKTMTCLQKNDFKCTKNIIKILQSQYYDFSNDFASWSELAHLIDMFNCLPAVYDGIAFHFAHLIKNQTDTVMTALNDLPAIRKPGAQNFFHQAEIFYMLSFENKITPNVIDGYSIKELLLCDLIEIEKEKHDQDKITYALDLSDFNINSLRGFDDIPDIKHITHLMLDNNVIQTLPDNFLSQCIYLDFLSLRGNQLVDLPQSFLKNNQQLTFLDLSDNQLSLLPDTFLSHNTTLHTLLLDYNNLTTLPNNFLSTCTMLQKVNVSYNELTTLPNNFLSTCPYMCIVYLQNNKLQALPDNFLAQVAKLHMVVLNNNNITVLPPHFLENNQHQFFVLLDAQLITNLNTLSPHLQDIINKSAEKINRLQKDTKTSNTEEPPAKRQRT